MKWRAANYDVHGYGYGLVWFETTGYVYKYPQRVQYTNTSIISVVDWTQKEKSVWGLAWHAPT